MNTSTTLNQTTTTSLPDSIDTFKDKILPFFNRLSDLADAANSKLTILLWLSLALASWLSYFCYWLFELSTVKLLPLSFAFIIPTLFIWKLHATLSNVITLPSQLMAMGDGIRQIAGQFRNDTKIGLSNINAQKHASSKLKELVQIIRQLSSQGKFLAEISKQFAKTGKQELIEAVITVASPQFAILMSIATIGTAILVFCSVLTGIVYLVFN